MRAYMSDRQARLGAFGEIAALIHGETYLPLAPLAIAEAESILRETEPDQGIDLAGYGRNVYTEAILADALTGKAPDCPEWWRGGVL